MSTDCPKPPDKTTGSSVETDEFSQLFDEKPSSRLAWLVPSVLLHLLVLVAWLYMPEEEARVTGNRELVVRSDQAEQLKDFVEDANLEELKAEVSRLQEIKATMLDIRASQMAELTEFEKEMQSSIEDTALLLDPIAETQKRVISSLKEIGNIFDRMKNAYDELGSMIKKQDFPPIAKVATDILAMRGKLNTAQHRAISDLRTVQSQMDSANAPLSWLKDQRLKASWQKIFGLQEKVFSLQSRSTDIHGQININQRNDLKFVSENAAAYNDKIKNFDDNFKKNSEEHERTKKELSVKIEKIKEDKKKAEEEIKKIDSALRELKKQQNNIKKAMPKSTKTEEDKKKKAELEETLKRLSKDFSDLEKNKKKDISRQIKKFNDQINSEGRKLKGLKAPQLHRDRDKHVNNMKKALDGIAATKLGDTQPHTEALAGQEKAHKLIIELAKQIRKQAREEQ